MTTVHTAQLVDEIPPGAVHIDAPRGRDNRRAPEPQQTSASGLAEQAVAAAAQGGHR